MNKKTSTLFLLVLFTLVQFTSAETQRPVYPVDNPSFYLELVKNSADFSEYSDFSVTGYNFYSYNPGLKPVFGQLSISSYNISRYGINYTFGLFVSIDEINKVDISLKLKKEEIRNLISQYESKKEISAFILKFKDNKPQVRGGFFAPEITAGDYSIYYDLKKGEFISYSLPISLANEFPLLTLYKEKVENAGCSIIDDRISVRKNEALNKIYIISQVKGDCEKSKDYVVGNSFEIELPLKTNIGARFNSFWNVYKWYIIGLLMILACGLAFVIYIMNWKEMLKPSLEKIITLLILFTFSPWPRQIYVTPMFYTTFLFYGPVTLSEILSIPLRLGTTYGSSEAMFGRLFSNQMLSTYLMFAVFLIICYLLASLISYKTNFLKSTKTKTILSFIIFLVSFVGLLVLFISHTYNENALAFNIIIPLVLFSLFYIIYSLIQKRKK